MTLAYLGLGANLGDARQTIKDAVVCLAQHASVTVVAKSSLYRTEPVEAGGEDYLNVVAAIDTTLDADQLLALCLSIEQHFGRERPYPNAPRTLDLDVLLYGGETIDSPQLVVPHPRMTRRAFVLVPLLELDPALTIPGHGPAAAFLPAVADQRIEKVEVCQCRISPRTASSS